LIKRGVTFSLVDLPELIGYSYKFGREKRRIYEHGVFGSAPAPQES
jgi:hypothetical protein